MTPRQQVIAIVTLLAAVAAAPGCLMKRYEVSEADFDRYWSPQPVPTSPQTLTQVTVSGTKLPTRWIVRQTADTAAAEASIKRAIEQIKTGPKEVSFSVSPEQTKMIADILAQLRGGIESLEPLTEEGSEDDPKAWAELMASALRQMEELTRSESAQGQPGRQGRLSATSNPLLQMLVAYLNSHARGGLLAGMDVRDVGQLRQVLAQVILRLGFAAAAKRDTPDVRKAVVALMHSAANMDALEKSLNPLLLERFETAAPAAPGSDLHELAETGIKVLPKVLEVMEIFANQWDRVDRMQLELHKRDETYMTDGTLHVQPGKEVRLDDMLPVNAQPAIVFRGASRIIIVPSTPRTEETLVLFQPGKDGAVELRFEGPVYAMVRTFVMPLASGALKQVRAYVRRAATGRQLINVQMAMLADNDDDDPRRLLIFQDAQEKTIVRTLTAVESRATARKAVFSYLRPGKRYVYRHVKDAGE